MRPGDLVEVQRHRDNLGVWARRRPERAVMTTINAHGLVTTRGLLDDVALVMGEVLPGSRCLYMASVAEPPKKKPGPYGFESKRLTFHCLLWDGRPAWVSDDDCDLTVIT